MITVSRWLGRLILILYVLLVLVVLGARYWFLPQVDQWREPIADWLGQALGVEIHAEKIAVEWSDWLPVLQVHDLTLTDAVGHTTEIPHLQAQLKWQTFLKGQPLFSDLRITGLTLTLWRDHEYTLHVAGQTWQSPSATVDSDTVNHDFVAWLAQQEYVSLQQARLRWLDYSRLAEPLVLEQLEGVLRHQSDGLHFQLQASPQSGSGQSVQLKGHLQEQALAQQQLTGSLYVQLNELSPAVWRQWIDLPNHLLQASLDTQLWLELEHSQIHHVTLDTRIYNGVWESHDHGQLFARSLRVFASAPWTTFQAVAQEQPLERRLLTQQALHLEIDGAGLRWERAPYLTEALHGERLRLVAKRLATTPSSTVYIDEFQLSNKDVTLSGAGQWTPLTQDWRAGQWDITGRIQDLQLAALYRYFPTSEIAESVVDWLKQGLITGQVSEGAIRLKGNLYDFPYQDPAAGVFFVGGAFQGADIDYYPTTALEKGWPKVENAAGFVAVRGASLWVNQATAQLSPVPTEPVQAYGIQVHIDNFYAPQLQVHAQTQGPAQSYLGLMTTTDLGEWLGHSFDQSQATGQWQVPLALRVNLDNTEDVAVDGAIHFQNNTLHIFPQLPPIEQLSGTLVFSESGAQAQKIKGKWFDGPLLLQQQIGAANQFLLLHGRAQARALNQAFHSILPADALQGELVYQVEFGLDKHKRFQLKAQSHLQGLAVHLPAPLAKTKAQSRALRVEWKPIQAQQDQLQIHLGDDVVAVFESSTSPPQGFVRGAVGWNQGQPALPTTGLVLDLASAELDIEPWLNWLGPLWQQAGTSSFQWPTLERLRLKADKVTGFAQQWQHLTFTLQAQPKSQWRADMSASQVAGTVWWTPARTSTGSALVQADLQRLYWQPAPTTQEETPTKEFDLRLPDMRLHVSDLRWGQRQLGKLKAQGRASAQDVTRWQITDLSLTTPHGTVQATGDWILVGAQRGLYVDTYLESQDVGRWLRQLAWPDSLTHGELQAQATLQWRHLPWRHSTKDLQAEFNVLLKRGRISAIHSRAAKLLEFLSLQSLSRLARLDLDVRGALQEGFPFDEIQGGAVLKNLRLNTKDLRIVSPVGLIMLEGETDLQAELVDAQVVVVPNVDMSGAAIAAGIALNPVVGLSAFLTQWVLKTPLAKAMTTHYHIFGPWESIKTEELKIKEPETDF